MSKNTPTDSEFSAYTLAISDLEHVAVVARLIADLDPLFNQFGPMVSVPQGLHQKQIEAVFRRAEGIAAALNNDLLRAVLETGLIVTYARPLEEAAKAAP